MRRAADWLIGAVGMLVVLVVAGVVLFWAVSDPPGQDPPPGDDLPAAGVGLDRPEPVEPPADLGEDEVWYSGVSLDADALVTGGSTLRDVRAVGEDVVTRPGGLVAGGVVVDATVPFEVVEEELGDGTALRPAGSGEAAVLRTVEVLGRELRVVATGTVEVQDGRLVIVPRSIGLAGSEVLADTIADVVRRLVTITYDVEGLPEGFVLEDVTIQDDGFRVHLRGEDIRLLQ